MGADDVSAKKARRQAQERERAGARATMRRVESSEGDRLVPQGIDSTGLEEMVRWASERGDGWLRIVPALTGEVHWKWRFTTGRWKGHYVYWAQSKYEGATSAWTGLAGKLDLVDEGHLKPSKDVF